MSHNEMDTTRRRRVGAAVIVLAGVILLGSGTAKLVGVAPVVRQLDAFGFVGTVPLVGLLEVTSAILLLLRRTRSFGLVFTSAFMGGAIATHLQHQDVVPGLPAVLVLGLAWLGVALRHPEALWSFRSRRIASTV